MLRNARVLGADWVPGNVAHRNAEKSRLRDAAGATLHRTVFHRGRRRAGMLSAWQVVLTLLLAVVGAWLTGSAVRALLATLGVDSVYAGDVGGLAALAVFLVVVVVLAYRRFAPW